MSVLADVAQIVTSAGIIATAASTWANRKAIGVVHRAVNSTAMEQNARADQLTAALTDANVAVPDRLPTPPPPK